MAAPKALECVKCGGRWFMERGAAQYNAEQIFKFHKAPLASSMVMHVLECVTCRTLNIPDYVYDGFNVDLQKMASDFLNAVEQGATEVKPGDK